MTLLADHTTHPRTYRFQYARPERLANGWLPDAVTDTTAKRERRAKVLLGDGCGVLPRLWVWPGCRLWHVVIPLPDDLDFYPDARRAGQAELRHLAPEAPALAQVACGRHAHLHVHALVALPEGCVPPRLGSYGSVSSRLVESAEHLHNLARYFSRPADERSSRPGRSSRRPFTPEQLRRQRLDASEMYLEARSRIGRLPRRRWQQNISRPYPAAGEIQLEQAQQLAPSSGYGEWPDAPASSVPRVVRPAPQVSLSVGHFGVRQRVHGLAHTPDQHRVEHVFVVAGIRPRTRARSPPSARRSAGQTVSTER